MEPPDMLLSDRLRLFLRSLLLLDEMRCRFRRVSMSGSLKPLEGAGLPLDDDDDDA